MKPESEQHLHHYAEILGSLSPETLEQLKQVLADDVRFIDPFNDLAGRDSFLGVMAEMFEKLDDVRFEINDKQLSGDTGYLYWRFSCSSKLVGQFSTQGCSRVVFDSDNKVLLHQDFWDASLLLQQFPLLGRIIRTIRRRAAYHP